MTAELAEIVGQDVAIQLVAELSTKRAAAYATNQSAENGTENQDEGDAEWAGNGANGCTSLAAGQC